MILALGMLVDNAIVVVEGILIGMRRGLSKLDAAVEIVQQTRWPLLGATLIALSALISLADRRLRIGAPSARRIPVAQPAE